MTNLDDVRQAMKGTTRTQSVGTRLVTSIRLFPSLRKTRGRCRQIARRSLAGPPFATSGATQLGGGSGNSR